MDLDVRPYTIATLRELLTRSLAVPARVNEKVHLTYFEEYLGKVGARTIVVEGQYIDHDYLDDFAAYYVRCFHPYERICRRLHFFATEFTAAELESLLRGQSGLRAETLQQHYRGFLVVRPLPSTVVGRTCLAPYDSDNRRRHYPTSVKCRANLYGVDLSLVTVPFQEQDHVTAACATSALWSCFQCTGPSMQHRALSPVEITKAATSNTPLRSRALPSEKGLTVEQMANAVRSVGLEPYYVATANADVLRKVVNAYVSGGVPAILIFELRDVGSVPAEKIGHHGVAITGFSRPAGAPIRDVSGARFVSARIDKLFVHDDQVGPHARMKFVHETNGSWHLSTSWGLNNRRRKRVIAEPSGVLVLLPEKVRTSYRVPLDVTATLNRILEALGLASTSDPLEWDVRLQTSNVFKSEVMNDKDLFAPIERVQHLTACWPRHLWRATGRSSSGPEVELICDATDIDSGRFIRLLHFADPGWREAIERARASKSRVGLWLQELSARIDTSPPG